MIKNITERKQLLKEFNLLKTIQDKFDFWEKKLGLKYPAYCIAMSHYNYNKKPSEYSHIPLEFQEFIINPKSKEDVLEYNNLCIGYIKDLDMIAHKKMLYDEDELKNQFTNELGKVKNKNQFISHKLNALNDFVAENSRNNTMYPFSQKHSFFKHGFEENYFNDKEIDLSVLPHDIYDTVALLNGHAHAELKKFIESYSSRGKKLGKLKEKKEISIKQQLLILQYLGVWDFFLEINHSRKSSQFLSLLLCKNEQNIRAALTEINNLNKNKADLEILKELFMELGDKKVLNKINKDLEKL